MLLLPFYSSLEVDWSRQAAEPVVGRLREHPCSSRARSWQVR